MENSFEFRVGQDVKCGLPAITRGLDRLDGLCRGRTSAVADVRIFNFPISGEPEIGWQPVKGLDRLSGDWRAIKRAPIALDRLPPPSKTASKRSRPSPRLRALKASAPAQDSKEAIIKNRYVLYQT